MSAPIMEVQNQAHPTPRQLAAYKLGKLTSDSRVRMEAHLARCERCASFVNETPRDALVKIFRQAQLPQSEQSTPGARDANTIAGLQRPGSAPVAPQSVETPASSAPPSVGPREPLSEALRTQDKYRIVRLLGRGGMGSVYEAFHNHMHRKVALKVVNQALVDHPEALRRFEEEMRAVGRLDHPNVTRAHDADRFGTQPVLVMEYVPGKSLDKYLALRGPLPVAEACDYIRQAAAGLQHAFERGLVHRDLKPQNLMLTPQENRVRILDFGLAKLASERRAGEGLTRENTLMGTPHYLAPEQALDAATADIRADIYGLGCTLYCLLTGAPPFNGSTEMKVLLAHQNETAVPLSTIRADVPPVVSDLVAQMLAKDPAARPQTPGEVAHRLVPYATGAADHAPAAGSGPFVFVEVPGTEAPVSKPSPAPQVKKRIVPFAAQIPPVAWWIGGACGILLLCGIVWWGIGNGSPERATSTAGKIGEVAPATSKQQELLRPEGYQSRVPQATVFTGDWSTDGEELVQSGKRGDGLLAFGDPKWQDYDFTFQAKTTGGEYGCKALFHLLDRGSFMNFEAGAFENHTALLVQIRDNKWINKKRWERAGSIPLGQWYDVHLQIRGTRCVCMINGVQIFERNDLPSSSGRVGLATVNDTAVRFRNIKVMSTDGDTVLWEGNPLVPGEARAEQPSAPAPNLAAMTNYPEAELRRAARWTRDGDQLVSNGSPGDINLLAFGDPHWANYTLTFRVNVEAGPDGFIVLVHADDFTKYNNLQIEFGGYGNKRHVIDLIRHGARQSAKLLDRTGSVKSKTWHDVRIEVDGNRIQGFFDDSFIFDRTADGFSRGRIGLGTAQSTEARFRDIRVTGRDGKVLWQGNPALPRVAIGKSAQTNTPDSNASPTTSLPAMRNFPVAKVVSGTWTVQGDELVQTSDSAWPALLLFGDPAWERYNLTLQLKATVGEEAIGVCFNAADQDNFRSLDLGTFTGTRHRLATLISGKPAKSQFGQGTFDRDRWYDIRVEVRGAECKCMINGVTWWHDRDETRLTRGRVGLDAWRREAHYRDIVVTDEFGNDLWRGLPKLPG